MNYKELFIAIAIMIVLTLIYFLLRKFIFWVIDDHDKFYKKKGKFGFNKEDRKNISDIPVFKLTFCYILLMVLLIIYIIKLLVLT